MKKILAILLALLALSAAAQTPTAIARLSVVAMRARPAHSAEQVSQVLMGYPLQILEKGKDWSRVRGIDGYEGWIINHSLVFPSPARLSQWENAPKVMVSAPYELHDADRTTDLVCGDILELVGDSLRLPDGRMILTPAGAVTPLGTPKPLDPALLPEFAKNYLGVPYLWGGLSSKGMDCSGLVRMAYAAQGRILPRDAWQQALEGTEVPADSLRPGDLIFFGNPSTRRVTHVAIYAGDSLYVHASQLVRINSLDPASTAYLPLHVLARRRVPATPLQLKINN